MTPAKQRAQVNPIVSHFHILSVKEVAAKVRKSPKYMYRCIVSAMDESKRQQYGISYATLRRMPVRGWFQQGGEWVITEENLARQLR